MNILLSFKACVLANKPRVFLQVSFLTNLPRPVPVHECDCKLGHELYCNSLVNE